MKNIFSHLLKKTGLFTVIVITLGLTGCSTMQSINPVNLFSTETARRCVDKVNIKGRFSILYKLDDREESLHGKSAGQIPGKYRRDIDVSSRTNVAK